MQDPKARNANCVRVVTPGGNVIDTTIDRSPSVPLIEDIQPALDYVQKVKTREPTDVVVAEWPPLMHPQPIVGRVSPERPLNVKDALSYLNAVKFQFQHRPDVYNLFLDIMKDFKGQL